MHIELGPPFPSAYCSATMAVTILSFALLASCACARSLSLPAGVYGLSDADPRAPQQLVVARSKKDGSLTVVASAPHDVEVMQGLAAVGVGGVAYALALVEAEGGKQAMAVATVDISTANITALQNTGLPVESPFAGYSQQLVFMADTGEVLLQSDTATGAPDENHTLIAFNPSTGGSRNITYLPGNTVFDVFGTLSGYSPKTKMYWSVVRNASGAVQSLFVNTSSGAYFAVPTCFASSGGYDPVTDSFVGLAIYRNGTTIKDVYWSLYSIPSSGGPCTYSLILCSDSDPLASSLIDGAQAVDYTARELYFYGTTGSEPTSAVYSYTAHLDTGAFSRGSSTFPLSEFPDSFLYSSPPA